MGRYLWIHLGCHKKNPYSLILRIRHCNRNGARIRNHTFHQRKMAQGSLPGRHFSYAGILSPKPRTLVSALSHVQLLYSRTCIVFPALMPRNFNRTA
jgi:hypothetical protein